MRRVLLAIALAVLVASPAFAQTVPVQNVPQELRSSSTCIDTRPAAGAAATATVPAQQGQSFYVNSVEVNASVATAALTTASSAAHATTTGLGGITFGMFAIAAQAAGTKLDSLFYALSGFGVKGANSTAVVVSTPAVPNLNWHIGICGYYAP